MRSIVSPAAVGYLLLLLTPSESFVTGGGVGAVTTALSSSNSGTGGYLDSLSDYSAYLQTLREVGDSDPQNFQYEPLPTAPQEAAQPVPPPPPAATAAGGGGAGGEFMSDLGETFDDVSGSGATASSAASSPSAPLPLVRDASEVAWNSAVRGAPQERKSRRSRGGGMGIGGIDPFRPGATTRLVDSLMTEVTSSATAEALWSRAEGVAVENEQFLIGG